MASLTITIPDTDVPQRALDLGYATLAQQGETQGQFLKRMTTQILLNRILEGQRTNAMAAAMNGLPVVTVT